MAVTIKKIFSEQPEFEQWQLLSRFAYPRNIGHFFHDRGAVLPSDTVVETIAAGLLQAREYFETSRTASLNISPLLLYYGTVNLLYSVSMLRLGTIPDVRGHGMTLATEQPGIHRVGDCEVKTNNPHYGILSFLLGQYAPAVSAAFPYGSTWKLSELFGSIPELWSDYQESYRDSLPFVLPVERFVREEETVERLNHSHVSAYPDDILDDIDGLSSSFLRPQLSPNSRYVILRPRLEGSDIGVYSMNGQKYLQIAHTKGRGKLVLPPVLYFVIALYGLGFISRYRPHIWAPFVRSDSTGEKHLIDRFVQVSRRCIPNLALNHLYDQLFVLAPGDSGVVEVSRVT